MASIHLKKARIAAGLTQATLARRIQKHQSFICKLERGVIVDPPIGEVVKIGRVLGVDPLALRFGQTEASR